MKRFFCTIRIHAELFIIIYIKHPIVREFRKGRGQKLDSYKVIELANKYSAAAEEVRSSKMLLESRLSAMGDAWQGKARDSFDQDFEETKAAYDQFEQELLETSQELKAAAVKIEERKAEIARMEELERKAREEKHKLGR